MGRWNKNDNQTSCSKTFFSSFFRLQNGVCAYTLEERACLHALVCILPQGHIKIQAMSASHLDKWKESAKTSLNGPLA